jgi:hypothetical protein
LLFSLILSFVSSILERELERDRRKTVL